ncbi:MAG: 2'-5' RNA ligase family protein [Clostridia bacterium]|nr:2'-5' RNA ligase family protein [Clostridia bacterium]
MYVWTAIDVDDQLKEIKGKAQGIEKNLNFENSAFTLPSHISLKISFSVSDTDYPCVVETLLDYYKTVTPFCVDVEGIETENTIVWIRIKENAVLNRIHKDLDRILMEKHGIVPHQFDLDFKFHSTLFLDSDKEKIKIAYHQIKDVKVPLSLCADAIIIGASPSGDVGTYGVTHTISLHEN